MAGEVKSLKSRGGFQMNMKFVVTGAVVVALGAEFVHHPRPSDRPYILVANPIQAPDQPHGEDSDSSNGQAPRSVGRASSNDFSTATVTAFQVL
jgi:hypothetical protein